MGNWHCNPWDHYLSLYCGKNLIWYINTGIMVCILKELRTVEWAVMYYIYLIFAGRFTFHDENVLSSLDQKRCLAIKYVDDDGKPTQTYPLNPNGSPCKLIQLKLKPFWIRWEWYGWVHFGAYVHTDEQSPYSTVLLQKLIVTHLVKKWLPLLPFLRQVNPDHMLSSCFSHTFYYHLIYPCVFKVESFLQDFLPKPCMHLCSLTYVPPILFLSCYPWFAHPVWRVVQNMNLCICLPLPVVSPTTPSCVFDDFT